MSVVEAYTGLMGSGKTLALVEIGLRALAEGSTVYGNFPIGRHDWGYLGREGEFQLWPRLGQPYYRDWFRREFPEFRVGTGFLPHPNMRVLRDWEHFCNIRVWRDPLGVAHMPGCDFRRCDGCSKGILILIDEVNSWAPSRHWQDMGVGLLTKFTYIRKHGLALVVSAQNEERLDVALRHLLEYTWVCRPGGFWTETPDHRKVPSRVRGWPLAWFNRERFIAGQLTDAIRYGKRDDEGHLGVMGGMAHERHWFSDRVAQAYDTYEEVQRPGTKKIGDLIWREAPNLAIA